MQLLKPKGNQVLEFINVTFVYKDYDTVKRLFMSLVRPHLEYANVYNLFRDVPLK